MRADCPGCEVVFDEAIVHEDGTVDARLSSTAIATGRLTNRAVMLDDSGFGAVAPPSAQPGTIYSVLFNPRLCTRHDVQACRSAGGMVVAVDHVRQEMRTYPDLETFEAQARVFTGCTVSAGIATCSSGIPRGRPPGVPPRTPEGRAREETRTPTVLPTSTSS